MQLIQYRIENYSCYPFTLNQIKLNSKLPEDCPEEHQHDIDNEISLSRGAKFHAIINHYQNEDKKRTS